MPDTSSIIQPIQFKEGYTNVNVGQPLNIPTAPPDITVGKDSVQPLNPLESALSQAYYSVGQQGWVKNANVDTPYKSQLQPTLRYDDPNLGFTAFDPNLEQKYGDAHPVKSSVNNILKFGANAVGSFANGLLTIPNIIGSAINGKLSFNYDNTVTKGINDWMTNLENTLPSYETSYKKEHPWASYLTFWNLPSFAYNWTNVAKNLGYTVGALGSAVVEDLGIGAVTGGTGFGAALAANYSQLGKLAKYLSAGEEASQAFNIAVKGGKSLTEAIDIAAKANKIGSNIRYGLGLFTSAYGEGVFEAANIYSQTKQDLTDQYRQDNFGNDPDYNALKKIEGASKSAADTGILFNTALLMATNSITLGNILKPTELVEKQAQAEVAEGLSLKAKNLNEFEVVPNAPRKGLLPILKNVASSHMVHSSLSEGFEEGAQYVISQGTEDYYTRRLNNDDINSTDNFLKSISKGIHDTLFTTQGMENIVMGALSGVLIHGINKISDKVRGVQNNKMTIAQNIQNMMNGTTTTSLFQTQYDEAVTATSLAGDYDKSVKSGDIYQAKNLRFQQLFNFIESGTRANKFDLRIGQLQMLKELTDDNFKNLFGIEYNAKNKQNISSFVDNVITEANRIKGHIDKVNDAFSNPFIGKKNSQQYRAFEYYKTQLALSAATIENNKERVANLSTDIKTVAPTIDPNRIMALTSEKGIKSLINNFEDKIRDLKNSENLASSDRSLADSYVKDREFLEEKVKNLKKISENKDDYDYIKEVNELHNYFANAESTKNDNVFVDQLDSLNIYNKSHDMAKLTEATTNGIQYYNNLLKKGGFDTFSLDVLNRLQEHEDNVHIDDKGNIQLGAKPEVKPEEETPVEPSKVTAQHDKDYTPEQKQQLEQIAAKEQEGQPLTDEELQLKSENVDAVEKEKQVYDINKKRKDEAQAKRPKTTPASTNKISTALNPNIEDINIPNTEGNDEPVGHFETNVTPKERSFDQVFSSFNPLKYLNQMYSPSDRRADGSVNKDYNFKAALQKILFGKKPEQVREKINVEVATSTMGGKTTDYYKLPDIPNIYRRGYGVDATVKYGNTVIGIMTEPTSLYFLRNGQHTSIYNMTKEEYAASTGNSIQSYDLFMQELNNYKGLYDGIIGDFKEGKKEISNETIRKVANIEIAYGNAETTNNPAQAPLLSKVTVRQKGDVVLSLPTTYNPTTKVMERTSRPNIINRGELTPEQIQETEDFISNNLGQIQGLNRRYVYLNRMPDGTFSKKGIWAARPVSESNSQVNDLFNQLKSATTPEAIKEFNSKFANEIYISDSRRRRDGKADINLRLEENGDISLTVHTINKIGEKLSRSVTVSKARLEQINSVDALTEEFNDLMSRGDLGRLGMRVTAQDFKRSILDDEKTSMADIENKLTIAARTPDLYNNYSIRFTNKKAEEKVERKTEKTTVVTPIVSTKSVMSATVPKIGSGEIKAVEVKDNNDIDKNQYTPDQQLKFNQGVHFEAVTIIADPDFIKLVQAGSERNKALTAKNPNYNYKITNEQLEALETKLGISAFDAYKTAKEIAKENRSKDVPRIAVIGTESNTKNAVLQPTEKGSADDLRGKGRTEPVTTSINENVKQTPNVVDNSTSNTQPISTNNKVTNFSVADATEFANIVNEFRGSSELAAANITEYTPEDYSNMKVYLSKDKQSGYAIKPNGELVSVFSKVKGRGESIVQNAVKNGAVKLDAYDIDGKLPSLYGKFGFVETERLKFDPQYADPNNKLINDKKPDVVYMAIPQTVSSLNEPTVGTATEQQEVQRRIDNLRMAMIDRKDLTKALQNGEFGMLTGENPNAQQATPEENIKYNKKAEKWLKDKGYLTIPIVGKYGNVENSFYVPNLSYKDAVAFAKEFNQESVATNFGLVYQDGTYNPRIYDQTTVGVDYTNPEANYFSVMNAFGTPTAFSLSYDFDTKTTLEEEKRKKEEANIKPQMSEEQMRITPVDNENENEEEQAKHRFAIYQAWASNGYDEILRNGSLSIETLRDILKSTGKGEEYIDDIKIRLNNDNLNYEVTDVLKLDRKSMLFQHVRNYMVQNGSFEAAIRSGILSPVDANALLNVAGIRAVSRVFNYEKVIKPLEELIAEKIEQQKKAKAEAKEDVKTVIEERVKRTRKPIATKVEGEEITKNGMTPEELEAEATRLIEEADNLQEASPVLEEQSPIDNATLEEIASDDTEEEVTPLPEEVYQHATEEPVEEKEESLAIEKGDEVTFDGIKWNVLDTFPMSGRLHIQTDDAKAGIEKERIISQDKVQKIINIDPHANDTYIRVLERMQQRFPQVKWKLVSSKENWKGRFKDGVVEVNTRIATKDTPIHEYLHPFVYLLRKDNESLYRHLISELQQYGESYILEVAGDKNYENTTSEEKLDEALVRYLSNAMSQNFDSEGRRYDTESQLKDKNGKVIDKQSAWYERATKSVKDFYTWLKDKFLSLLDRRDVRNKKMVEHEGFDLSNTEDLALLTELKGIAALVVNKKALTDEQKQLRAEHKDVIKKEANALRARMSERKETSFIKATDQDFGINMTPSDFDFNFTLEDLADFLSFNDNVQLDYGKDINAINTLESYQFATSDEAKKLLDRVKAKAEQLEQTANKRFPTKGLQDELIGLRTLIRDYNQLTFAQDYIRLGVGSLEMARRTLRGINSELREDNLKNLKPEDIQRLNRDVMEVRTLYGMYEDVNKMLDYNVDDFERDEFDDLRRDLDAAIVTKQEMGNIIRKLTTEWLFPEFDELQQKVIASNPTRTDLILTKEKFAQKLRYIERDSSFLTYWLGSAITSRDPIAQVISVKIKDILNQNYEEETKLATDVNLSYRKFLAAKGLPNDTKKVIDYYKNNYVRTIQSWEVTGVDDKGERIYGYVDRLALHTEFDWHRWDDDLRKEMLKYPKAVTYEQQKFNDTRRIDWIKANSQTINGEQSPSEKYRNSAYTNLKNDEHFQLLSKAYTEANDKYKDQSLSYGIIPQAYKPETILEKVKDRLNRTKEYGKELKDDKTKTKFEKAEKLVKDSGSKMLGGDAYESIEDLNLDETYYRNIKSPYTHLIKDQNELDLNLPETILSFYKASNYYSSLKELQPNIENFKLLLTSNPKFGIEARKAMKVSRDLDKVWDRFAGKPQTETAERLNKQLLAQLNDVFYGDADYNMDVNLAGIKMNLNSVAKNAGFYTAARNLAGNLFAGISNVTIGNAQTLAEAVGGRHYGVKDWAKAEGQYWLNLGRFISDGAVPIKSKITQLGVRYDAIQGEFRDKNGKYITGSVMRKINTSSLFFLSHAGEHQIQLTGMLALMNATKVKLQGGGEVSLYDAYSTDKDGYLKIRPDAIWNTKNDLEFTRKLHSISRDLNGAYADYDKSMLQRYWIGRLVLQYRKYMYPAFRARFARERIDLERGDVDKGYYRVFMRKLINEAKQHQWKVWNTAYDTLFNKKQMTEQEKYAIGKFKFDMLTFGLMTVLGAFLVGGSGSDDDKKKQWLINSAGLLTLRLRSDIGTYSLQSAQDFSKQLQNPAASIQSITNILDFLGQFVNDTGSLITGQGLDEYKTSSTTHDEGDSKLGAKFKKIVPVWRQWNRAMNPQDQIQYYQLTNQGIQH